MKKIEVIKGKMLFCICWNIFKIPLRSGFAHMMVRCDFFSKENVTGNKIVIVDRGKFLNLWQKSLRSDERLLAAGDESAWRRDYKFHYAETAFSGGIDNPVPLADLQCHLRDKEGTITSLSEQIFSDNYIGKRIPYCSFTDGITRTLWLLANGAESFPVRTDSYSYERLKFYAGAEGTDDIIQSLMDVAQAINT